MRHPTRRMPKAWARAGSLAALVALLGALVTLGGCASEGARPPDVVLVTIDRLDWTETALAGGPVSTPVLASLAGSGFAFEGLVAPHPGGAPAAVSVLTGVPPGRHGVQSLLDARMADDVETLAERFDAMGHATGAFLQTDQLPLVMGADRGFRAWDAPTAAFPDGHPGRMARRPARAAFRAAMHWLRQQGPETPAFAWVHLAEPAASDAPPAERAAEVAAVDRLLGQLVEMLARRAQAQETAFVVAVASLAGVGEDATDADAAAYRLDESSVRVRALVAGGDVPSGASDRLAGLDELGELLVALAGGEGESRLLDVARGDSAAGRSEVVAETLVPWTSLGAQPLRLEVGDGPSAPGTAGAAAAVATGSGRSAGRPRAEETVDAFRRLSAAWRTLDAGDAAAAVVALEALHAEHPDAPGPLAALGIARVRAGDLAGAREAFRTLGRNPLEVPGVARQAAFGLALVAEAEGRPSVVQDALRQHLERSPDDVEAMRRLAESLLASAQRAAATGWIDRMLVQDIDNPHALRLAARVAAEGGKHEQAAALAERALARRPVDDRLLIQTAVHQKDAGDYWTALQHLDEHVTIFGETLESEAALAELYEHTRRWRLAADYLARLVERRPEANVVRVRLGRALLGAGDEGPGREALAAAAELAPESALPCVTLAGWLADAGRLAEAHEEAQRCAARHPGDPAVERLAAALPPPSAVPEAGGSATGDAPAGAGGTETQPAIRIDWGAGGGSDE